MKIIAAIALLSIPISVLTPQDTIAAVKDSRTQEARSWGKAGVSFVQYQVDAFECGGRGYFRDVSGDEPAKRFVRGFRTADDNLNMPSWSAGAAVADSWSATKLRTQPERQIDAVQKIQMSDVESCLTAKGYKAFVLTKEQASSLSRKKKGSLERRKYLYDISVSTN